MSTNEASTFLHKLRLATTWRTILAIAVLPGMTLYCTATIGDFLVRKIPRDWNDPNDPSDIIGLVITLLSLSPCTFAYYLVLKESEHCRARLENAGYHEKESHWYHITVATGLLGCLAAWHRARSDESRRKLAASMNMHPWAWLGSLWGFVTILAFLMAIAPIIWFSERVEKADEAEEVRDLKEDVQKSVR